MNWNGFPGDSSSALLRVPTTVFLFLGVNRLDAHKMGMIGCGLQLDDSGEYAWRETTISLDMSNAHVRVFLKTRNIPFSVLPENDSVLRIHISLMKEYVLQFANISSFMDAYQRNRFLRLGSRAFLDPWDLDSRDAFMLRMSEEDFSSSFITDPRGRPLHSEVTSKIGRHSPKQIRAVPGMPVPGLGSWI
jgi:hypothetical protein